MKKVLYRNENDGGCDYHCIFHILLSDASIIEFLENPRKVALVREAIRASIHHGLVVNSSPGDAVVCAKGQALSHCEQEPATEGNAEAAKDFLALW